MMQVLLRLVHNMMQVLLNSVKAGPQYDAVLLRLVHNMMQVLLNSVKAGPQYDRCLCCVALCLTLHLAMHHAMSYSVVLVHNILNAM